jgi:Icc protein
MLYRKENCKVTRIAWCSDIHLNFVPLLDSTLERFAASVRAADADMLVVCGDISGGGNGLKKALESLELHLDIPIRFCLGNHDAYNSTFARVRSMAREAVRRSVVLHDDVRILSWLSDEVIEEVSDDTALIGHDGWYDARIGLLRNRVFMNDFYMIGDLKPFSARFLVPDPLLLKIREIADESAAYLDRILPQALARRCRVVLVTHVPPFPQAALHRGQPSDPDFLPFYCSIAVGKVLVRHMEANPDKELLVLCGHTHGEADAQILPNLRVLVAGAEYGKLRLQGIIEV